MRLRVPQGCEGAGDAGLGLSHGYRCSWRSGSYFSTPRGVSRKTQGTSLGGTSGGLFCAHLTWGLGEMSFLHPGMSPRIWAHPILVIRLPVPGGQWLPRKQPSPSLPTPRTPVLVLPLPGSPLRSNPTSGCFLSQLSSPYVTLMEVDPGLSYVFPLLWRGNRGRGRGLDAGAP